jgi:hypothetical protein
MMNLSRTDRSLRNLLVTILAAAAILLAPASLTPGAFGQGGCEWELVVSGTGSRCGSGHAVAYDSARGVTILFGGTSDTVCSNTWEWDGVEWTLVSEAGPSARAGHAMAYDSARGVTILFGGAVSIGPEVWYNHETWEWDGVEWTLVSEAGPSARAGHAMAYDSARGVTVLFGGDDGPYGGSYLNDTWEWDGVEWTLRSQNGPSARGSHAMAYDSVRGVTVLFGGQAFAGLVGDTWEWDGAEWTLRSQTGPSARAYHAMAYDSARGVTVLFFGERSRGTETWEYRCALGLRLSVAATCPAGGPIRVEWEGATPNGRAALIFARNTGSVTIPPQYPCAGTQLGLGASQIQLAWQGGGGADGSRILSASTGSGACGGYLQLLDLTTCGTSNVARVE